MEEIDGCLREIWTGGKKDALTIHIGFAYWVELKGGSINVASWEAEFAEQTCRGGKVPNRTSAGIRFWEFKIERRSMVNNPAGVKNGAGIVDCFCAGEASLFCEGFKLIAECWFVGPGDKAVVDH